MEIKKTRKTFRELPICLALLSLVSCSEFLDIDPPNSKIESSVVFNDDVTAESVVLGIYTEFLESSNFASGTYQSLTTLTGLSSDELVNNPLLDGSIIQFQENAIQPENGYVLSLWSSMYKVIYQSNVVIEGVPNSERMSESVKSQLLGEALFIRGFCNFYLVNLFGDVPLVTTSNYLNNKSIPRTESAKVYDQIVIDLESARGLLQENYVATSGERIRVNKFAATAFLARVYLFLGQWSLAEELATVVISKSDMYSLKSNLQEVFLKNSTEAIWQIRPAFSTDNGYTNEASLFSPSSVINNDVIRRSSVFAYEEGDQRAVVWLDTVFTQSDTLYFPRKYKQDQYNAPMTEYSMVLRLAEQFLIRAEARAMQDNLVGQNSAVSDIDIIRNRAGLLGSSSISREEILDDIMQEKRIELFSEWGHRWLDLKRTDRSVVFLGSIKAGFSEDDQLFPIPATEFIKNPELLRQNKGY